MEDIGRDDTDDGEDAEDGGAELGNGVETERVADEADTCVEEDEGEPAVSQGNITIGMVPETIAGDCGGGEWIELEHGEEGAGGGGGFHNEEDEGLRDGGAEGKGNAEGSVFV